MSGRGGFSLVEVLVALVVLEVGILGVLAMTLQAQKTLLAAIGLEDASRACTFQRGVLFRHFPRRFYVIRRSGRFYQYHIAAIGKYGADD